MRQSNLFLKTKKKAPREAKIISHKLLLRGGFISQLASGIYSFLPLGLRVHRKIENIIREEMNNIGGQEVFLPTLQPKQIWKKTNRWDNMDPPLFRLQDQHQREFALGSTHEEVITSLAASRVQSYKDLPFYLYQIQNKFRNEVRATGGLLRTREFMMKDLYSFNKNKEGLDHFFNKVLVAYQKIYKRCGLQAIKTEASGGVFTSEKTYEFQVLAKTGEDKIIFCPNCNWATNLEVAEVKPGQDCPICEGKLEQASSIEVGHTFRLGTKYSEDLGLFFKNEKGKKQPVVMGCYGIGIGRLMGTIVEICNDKKGIIWPIEVAPFEVHLIQIGNSEIVKKSAQKLYQDLQKEEIEVLYDDRPQKTAGEKFAEADLIGIPYRIVISQKTLKEDSIEIKKRDQKKEKFIKNKEIINFLNSELNHVK